MAQQITIDIVAETQRLQKGLDDANKKLAGIQTATNNVQNLSSAFVGVGVAAAGFGIATNFIGDATDASSDLGESINAVNVAYGEAAEGVLALGEKSAEALGVSQTEFNAAAVRFSAFAERVVGQGGNVAGFIDDISIRAADFASVFNIEVSEALGVFQSGLSGEAEPLKRFGINLLQAEVQAYALRTGLIEVGETMTEEQKVQARYGLLMEATAKTAGDFANTSDGLANSQRILEAQQKDLSAEIGETFLPIMLEINKIVKLAVGIFSSLPKPVQQGAIVVGLLAAVIAPAILLMSSMITAIGTMKTVLGGFQIATKIATVAQAIFNGTMLANPITLVIAGIIALIAIIVLLVKNWDKVSEVLADVWENIQNFVKDAVKAVGDMVTQLGKFLGKILQVWLDTWKNIGTFVGDTITRIIDAFLEIPKNMIGIGRNIIEGLWNGISGLANWFRDKVLGFFGNLLPGWIKDVLGISSPSKVFEEVGKNIVQGTAAGLNVPRLSSRGLGIAGQGAVNITINAGLGTNPYQLGKEVNNALKSYSRVQRV